MQQYKDFRPTACDTAGLGLEERQDWWVLPTSRTRDSGPRDESNFQSALKILGGESETVETHRFGHWGPGWFEVIIVHPSRLEDAEKLESALADYPLLDDEDHSERENEEALKSWNFWAANDFIEDLTKVFGLLDVTFDWLREHKEELWEFHGNKSPVPYEFHSDGPSFNFNYLMHSVNRDDLAKFIREVRRRPKT